MTDEVREKYLKMVNIICEQFGLNKPSQIIYVCEAVENLIEPYMKESAELKQRITELVTAFNNYECAGPEQEQENTWEALRDKMHREIKRLEGKDLQKQSMSELDGR